MGVTSGSAPWQCLQGYDELEMELKSMSTVGIRSTTWVSSQPQNDCFNGDFIVTSSKENIHKILVNSSITQITMLMVQDLHCKKLKVNRLTIFPTTFF